MLSCVTLFSTKLCFLERKRKVDASVLLLSLHPYVTAPWCLKSEISQFVCFPWLIVSPFLIYKHLIIFLLPEINIYVSLLYRVFVHFKVDWSCIYSNRSSNERKRQSCGCIQQRHWVLLFIGSSMQEAPLFILSRDLCLLSQGSANQAGLFWLWRAAPLFLLLLRHVFSSQFLLCRGWKCWSSLIPDREWKRWNFTGTFEAQNPREIWWSFDAQKEQQQLCWD